MKRQLKTFLLALSLTATVLTACHDREYIIINGPDEELVKNPGRVVLDPDGLPADARAQILDNDNIVHAEMSPGDFADVQKGTYRLVTVTPREGLTVSGTTATLSAADAASLPQAPGFSAGVSTVTVVADKTVTIRTTIAAMTRQLVVKLAYTGYQPSDISSIEMDVYNPAASVDVSRGFGGVIASSGGERYTRAVLANPPTAQEDFSFNLLGFEPSAGHRIVIRFRLGATEEVFTQDITTSVAAFNNGPAADPLVLTATVSREDGEITGDIKPWEPGWNGGIEGQ